MQEKNFGIKKFIIYDNLIVRDEALSCNISYGNMSQFVDRNAG